MNVTDVVTQKLNARIKTLEAQVEELKGKLSNQKAAVDVEKLRLQDKLGIANDHLKKLIRREEREKEFYAEVARAVRAVDPLPVAPAIVKGKKGAKVPMSAVMHLTDWHVGERIQATETEGFGGYDWEMAQDRLCAQFVPDWLKWLDTQRSGYFVPNITVVGTGDYISGDIHDELRVTNEFPVPVQTAKAGDLLAWVVQQLAPHCEQLQLVLIGADNHSRLVKKPQAKQKASNSLSFLVHHIAKKQIEKISNVKVEEADGAKLLFKVVNTPILGEHGDTVKSWMSIPFYGMEREVAREAKRRMLNEKGFEYVIMGHWHASVFAPWSPLIVGGSLSGTSEYDHTCGRHARPHQTGFLVGKHGPFGFVPFKLR